MAKYKDTEELLKRLNSCKYSAEKTTKRQATYNAAISDACRIVDAISAVDIPRWIPVTEQLPEEDKEVLISYRYKEGEGDTSHINIDITTYGQMYFGGRKIEGVKHWRAPFEYFESNYEVIAWMPLPLPYKEGEAE